MANPINWRVVTGCSLASEGCESCPSYLHTLNIGGDYSVKTHSELLLLPPMTYSATTYMVAFGSDLFHESVPDSFIKDVFSVMNASTHKFEIATKRIMRVASMDLNWTDNIKLGVAVESHRYTWRIKFLQEVNAKFKFISAVPLLGDLGKIDLDGVNVVSAAKEEWGLFRPFKQEWVDKLREQCNEQGVFFSESTTSWEVE